MNLDVSPLSPTASQDLSMLPPEDIPCKECGSTLDLSDFEPEDTVSCPVCNCSMDVPCGVIGHYSIMNQVGEGAVGSVFRALDLELEREVALKLLPALTEENKPRVAEIRREARALAAINHPNVMQVHAVGEFEGTAYLVMEYLSGPHVDLLLKQLGELSEAESVRIALDIAHALVATHEALIVHGDVKPSNLMLGAKGRAKLVDFGQAARAATSETNEIWGTPYYIAPECLQGHAPTTLSDQYSLGATLFHMLTGEHAFNGEEVRDVLTAVLNAPLPNPRVYQADLSVKTCTVLRRMMQRDPNKRYATMEEVAAQLADAARGIELIQKFQQVASQ